MGNGWLKFSPKSLYLLLCNKRCCPSPLSLSRHPTRSWIHPEALPSKIKKKRNKGEGWGVKKRRKIKRRRSRTHPKRRNHPNPPRSGRGKTAERGKKSSAGRGIRWVWVCVFAPQFYPTLNPQIPPQPPPCERWLLPLHSRTRAGDAPTEM